MTDPTANFATPRMAAGAIFIKDDAVLLVRKTYGNRWDIPGGYVDRGESPAAACAREVREELSLDREPVRLLAVDWAPSDKEGDKVLWLFDCGELGDDEQRIQLDGQELDHWKWIQVSDLADYVIPRLERRLVTAVNVARTGVGTVYAEHGERTLKG